MTQIPGNLLYVHAGAELYGADRILLVLVTSMAQRGWSVTVILPNDGPLRVEMELRGVNVIVEPFPVLRRKYFNVMGVLRLSIEFFRSVRRLTDKMRELKIDVVHTNTLAVLPSAFAARRCRLPHVWHVHEIILHPRWLNPILSRIAFKYSDVIVAVSDAVRRRITEGHAPSGAKISVIHNGIDTDQFSPNGEAATQLVRRGRVIFGTIGRFNSWKGQLSLCRAAEKVFNEVPNSHCVLVGGVFETETQFLDEVREFIDRRGLQERFTILDFQKNATEVYRALDLFVLPSTNPDPLPTVVLEAMSSGLPVVAFQHGGVSEMVEHGKSGLLVEVGNIEAMSNAISSLLADESRRLAYGQAARERVITSFSVESFSSKFEELYEGLLSHNETK